MALRSSVTFLWDHVRTIAGRVHEITLRGDLSHRSLDGTVSESGVVVEDDTGAVVRRVTFMGPAHVRAAETPTSVALRDVWRVSPRVDVDAGVRIDHGSYAGTSPSARAVASSSIRGTSRSRKIGSPRIS